MTGLLESVQWLREAREERSARERELDAECEPGWTEYLRCPRCGQTWTTPEERDYGAKWLGIQLDPRPERETMIRLHLRNCPCEGTFTAVREVMRAGADGTYEAACDGCGVAVPGATEQELARRVLCEGCSCPATMRAT